MKQNIITVVILLGVVALSGMYGSWKNQQTPPPEASGTPIVETVVQSAPEEAKSLGDRLGVLRLGESRKEVEALHYSNGFQTAAFTNGVSGHFPRYPGEIHTVAYDPRDKAVAIRGYATLTLADGQTVQPGMSFSEIQKILGPGHEDRGEQNLPRLSYSERGISFVGSSLDSKTVSSIELTSTWTVHD